MFSKLPVPEHLENGIQQPSCQVIWRSNLDKLLSVGWMHHLSVLAATGVNSGYNCRIITFHFDVLTSPFGTQTAASMAMGSNSLRVIWDPVRFPAHSGWNQLSWISLHIPSPHRHQTPTCPVTDPIALPFHWFANWYHYASAHYSFFFFPLFYSLIPKIIPYYSYTNS